MFGFGPLELVFGILLVVVAAPAALLVRQSSRKGRPISPNRILALGYWIHAVMVGGFFFMVVAINTQGARSLAEANAAVTAALFQPVLMFLTAIALWFGGRWARLLAISLPILFVICYLARFFGASIQLGNRAPEPQFIAYFCDLQSRNFLGASILALVAGRFMIRDARVGRDPLRMIG